MAFQFIYSFITCLKSAFQLTLLGHIFGYHLLPSPNTLLCFWIILSWCSIVRRPVWFTLCQRQAQNLCMLQTPAFPNMNLILGSIDYIEAGGHSMTPRNVWGNVPGTNPITLGLENFCDWAVLIYMRWECSLKPVLKTNSTESYFDYILYCITLKLINCLGLDKIALSKYPQKSTWAGSVW